MAGVACPHCYEPLDRNRLWYQCSGRGDNPCRPARDDVLARLLGDMSLTLPSFPYTGRSPWWPRQAACPRCHALSGIRVCPRCHSPASSAFGSGPSRLIAVVGCPASGKSVYQKALMRELLDSARIWFDVDVKLGELGEAVRTDDLYQDRRLPSVTARTREGGLKEPAIVEWRTEYRAAGLVRRHRTTHLSFVDAAGGELSTFNDIRFQAYVDSADALMLVVDPLLIEKVRRSLGVSRSAWRPGSNTDLIGQVSEHLRTSLGIGGDRLIDLPVAVVVSKFDTMFGALGVAHPLLTPPPLGAFGPRDARETHRLVTALLDDWNAGDIDARLRMNFANFRYFPVSALGSPPDYETALVSPYGVRPFRVLEPLLWLLDAFKVAPEPVS